MTLNLLGKDLGTRDVMLKWMLQRSIHSVLELLEMDVMLLRSIQSVFEVDSNGCYNIASRASGKLVEMDMDVGMSHAQCLGVA